MTRRRLHWWKIRDMKKVTLQLSTTPSTPVREWSQSSSHSYSINSKTNTTRTTWRCGCARSCNWLVSKHDINISGSVQAWLHAFLNWWLSSWLRRIILDAASAWNRVPFVCFQHLAQFHSGWHDQCLSVQVLQCHLTSRYYNCGRSRQPRFIQCG